MNSPAITTRQIDGWSVRWDADNAARARADGWWPDETIGTMAARLAGISFALAVLGLLAAVAPTWLVELAGTGLCGALTTFSTFSFETVRLVEQARVRRVVARAHRVDVRPLHEHDVLDHRLAAEGATRRGRCCCSS